MSIQYPLIGSTNWGETINGNFLDLDTRETESSNKIGDLTGNGITEENLSLAIKNDRASLSERVKGVNKIYTDVNISELGLTLPFTCSQLAVALKDGDIVSCSADKISDKPQVYGTIFVKKINTLLINFEFRNLIANDGTQDMLYIASYKTSVSIFSGWKQVATTDDVAVNTSAISVINTKLADSGWLDIPFASGITNYENAKYRKIGNVVFLSGRIVGITGNSGTIGTLPSGYRPIYNFNTVVILAGGKTANLTITTAGVMTIYSTTTLISTDFVGLNCSFAI